MTHDDLTAIERRREAWLTDADDEARDTLVKEDVPALVAEVRRLSDARALDAIAHAVKMLKTMT